MTQLEPLTTARAHVATPARARSTTTNMLATSTARASVVSVARRDGAARGRSTATATATRSLSARGGRRTTTTNDVARERRPRSLVVKNASAPSRGSRTTARATSGTVATPEGDEGTGGNAGLVARVRAIAFFVTSFTLAVPLIMIMAIIFPFQYAFDRTRRRALSFFNDVWATVSTGLFFPIEVVGRENLPSATTAAVYVANHASFMDIYSMFHLRRPFKFVSKTSNFLIPVVGWSMYLTGHIPLKRMERRSQLEVLKTCREMLADGGSVLFFPEGTRSADGKMQAFKKGAFSVAAKENVPVVPVTIVGAHEAMASGKEYALNAGGIKVIVHPPIQSTDADDLCKRSEAIIKESLVNNS